MSTETSHTENAKNAANQAGKTPQTILQTKDKTMTYAMVRGAVLLKRRRAKLIVPWEFNRALDEDRVARMIKDQRERLARGEPLTLFLPVPITVCTLGASRTHEFLMDGQHRLAVLGTLAHDSQSEVAEAAKNVEVLLCTVHCASDAELEEVFVRINSGTPVPAAYYAKRVDTLLTEYCAQLAALWPLAHSEAEHPQRPGFNLCRVKDAMSSHTSLRDAIIDGRITVAALVTLTQRENDLERNLQGTPGTGRNVPERCLKGAIKSEFYLGLRKEWAVVVALRAVAGLGEPDS